MLPVLLDSDALAPFLDRALGSAASFPEVRVRHLRYAPGSKLVVRYDIALDERRDDAVAMVAARPYLARRAVKPENLALAKLALER